MPVGVERPRSTRSRTAIPSPKDAAGDSIDMTGHHELLRHLFTVADPPHELRYRRQFGEQEIIRTDIEDRPPVDQNVARLID